MVWIFGPLPNALHVPASLCRSRLIGAHWETRNSKWSNANCGNPTNHLGLTLSRPSTAPAGLELVEPFIPNTWSRLLRAFFFLLRTALTATRPSCLCPPHVFLPTHAGFTNRLGHCEPQFSATPFATIPPTSPNLISTPSVGRPVDQFPPIRTLPAPSATSILSSMTHLAVQ